MKSDLHAAVRQAYRLAMAEHRTQHQAFDRALALVLEQFPQEPGAARRAVAIMLANDPDPLGPLPGPTFDARPSSPV